MYWVFWFPRQPSETAACLVVKHPSKDSLDLNPVMEPSTLVLYCVTDTIAIVDIRMKEIFVWKSFRIFCVQKFAVVLTERSMGTMLF